MEFNLDIPSDTAVFKSVRKELNLKDGLLQRGGKILPPAQLRKDILLTAHQGHPGIIRMKAALRREYWWPCMVKQFERMVNSCPNCQRSSKSRDRLTALRLPSFRDLRHWENNGDSTSPDPSTMADAWLSSSTTRPDSQRFWIPKTRHPRQSSDGWIPWERYSYPLALVSGNGPQFTSKLFTGYLKEWDIHHYDASVPSRGKRAGGSLQS
ncbi:MAG: hypothetical protein GY696_22500, partial [Gammaproteobacteria bacterium]|nr:hypothetical protein [Gammaproteobacteria bacterium]